MDATPDATRLLLRALHGVVAEIAEPVVVLRTLLDQAVTQTQADRGVFVEVAPTGERTYRVLHRFDPRQLRGPAGHFSQTIFAHAAASGEAVLLHNALEDPRFMNQESVMGLRLASILCVPIRTEERIVALLHLENDRPGHFRPEHLELLRSLTEIAGPLLETLGSSHEVLEECSRLRIEAQETRAVLAQDWSFGRFVGRSPAVRELELAVRRASATDYPVLLLGESGTGKNVLARVLHSSSERCGGPFVTVFCPALERSLVEAELFGHKKGAFTSAVADRIGKIQAAEHGTLFLDEIGELPLETQPKLLRLLQEKTFEQVGDPRERRADVRVIAASNRDLAADVVTGHFRRDLFERLNFVPIRIPPLRERREDIPLLLRTFLDAQPRGRWIEIQREALDDLVRMDFAWPGNVRHLEQLAVRLALERPVGPVTSDELKRLLGIVLAAEEKTGGALPVETVEPAVGAGDFGLPEFVARAERAWLAAAVERHPGLTRAQLAARLGIGESTLYKKLRDYGLST